MMSTSGPTASRNAPTMSADLIDRLGRRDIVSVGDADDLDRVVAGLRDHAAALDDRFGRAAFVDGLHVAEPEMRVGAQMIAHLAAEQAPHGHAERFPENVPKRDLDAADRRHAFDAEPPEAVTRHDLVALLDVTGILPDQQGLEIFERADDGACLPFERGLAPAEQAGLVGLDPHEHPVAHFCVADPRRDRGYFHSTLGLPYLIRH